jgi:DNA polymerase-1
VDTDSSLALSWIKTAYPEVWACDFEFRESPEGSPVPVCMVAREVFGRRRALKLFANELPAQSPFAPDILFISFAAPAELSCFLELGWLFPRNILDLYVEARMELNVIGKKGRVNLLTTLAYYGLDGMDYAEKAEMRVLIMNQEVYTLEERAGILEYCEKDVLAIEVLLPRMIPRIPGLKNNIKSGSKKKLGWSQALFRGRYMASTVITNKVGVPIDMDLYNRLMNVRPQIRQKIIDETNAKYNVYEGDKFKLGKFSALLKKLDIWWPLTPTKQPKTDDETFSKMCETCPELTDLYHAKRLIKEMNSSSLVVKADGRSRAWLNPFGSNTGRNQPRESERKKKKGQPSSSNDGGRFIFGMSKWFRSFIQPKPGEALAYIDYSSQEVAVMAGLSGDPTMVQDYNNGDPHIALARSSGAVPDGATKKSHKKERDQYKTCFLATSYGQEAMSLSHRLGITFLEAEDMLAAHKERYPVYWAWTEQATVFAPCKGEIFAPLGWRMKIDDSMDGLKKAGGKIHSNYRTLLNWPVQATAADMLRLAACMATESGLRIAAPVHDAFLLSSSEESIEEDVSKLREIMAEASSVVLNGVIKCRTSVEGGIISWPDRYVDDGGAEMWGKVMGWMKDFDTANPQSELHRTSFLDDPPEPEPVPDLCKLAPQQ